MTRTVLQLIQDIERFKLKRSERENWELHSGDIVIHKSKWKKIKKQFLEAEDNRNH